MSNLNQQFNIGSVQVPGRLALGPMAGVTDSTFRNICKDMGASLLYTEMVSAKGIFYNNKNTEELLKCSENEHPLGLQLFGSDPDIMGDMAEKLKERPFDFIDVNMGCPVPKVVNNGEGSALMKNPVLVSEIVDALVKKAGKPVTVKIRKGFDSENCVEIAKAAESAGASAVAVHGRLRSEYYYGHADWKCIADVKKAVKIPVIGSGDVTDIYSCKRMFDETGVDCVMIARAALGNPWIFAECKAYMEDGTILEKPGIDEVKAMVLRQAEDMCADKGENVAMREMRKHVAWYFKGFPGSSKLRGNVNSLIKLKDLKTMLDAYN